MGLGLRGLSFLMGWGSRVPLGVQGFLGGSSEARNPTRTPSRYVYPFIEALLP